MRIISGKHKGRRLTAPKKLPVRPTTDMAKEALFNILNNRYYFSDIVVIDLFSGTGNISFEFASRGTENITAVDTHAGCIRFIEDTSIDLGLGINAVKSDVFDFLKRSNAKADVIFADPFYDMELEDIEIMVASVFKRNMLLEEGCLIIEHTNQKDLSQLEHFVEKRKYGGTAFSFFNH